MFNTVREEKTLMHPIGGFWLSAHYHVGTSPGSEQSSVVVRQCRMFVRYKEERQVMTMKIPWIPTGDSCR